MVKKEEKHYVELGDTVSHKLFPHISGIVSVITRNTQDVMQVSIESYNEDNELMEYQDFYMSDAIGENGESFSGDPKDYDEYFPKDDDNEFLFQLNILYQDTLFPLQGYPTSHSVCSTGCDRTKLVHCKKGKGMYGVNIDLTRIKLPSDPDGVTAGDTIKEEQKKPGGPAEMAENTL